MEESRKIYQEQEMKAKSGMAMLLGLILLMIICIAAFPLSIMGIGEQNVALTVTICIIAGIVFCSTFFLLAGLKVINPNEALVLTLFGQYKGTLKKEGFYWVNPFCVSINPTVKSGIQFQTTSKSNDINVQGFETTSKKISLKATTFENKKQKVNDELGNPIEIGAVVIWQVKNSAKAVFNVDHYKNYISTQCDSVIRNVARCYPYDSGEVESSREKTLRGSSQEVADIMKKELQEKVEIAGIEILEVRITHLSYAPEIASAMLQRQQAVAIIAARQKIVEGAVGMVEMALKQLNETSIVELDEERKAAMVSNLLVVLCGNKDTQPIINSGTIY